MLSRARLTWVVLASVLGLVVLGCQTGAPTSTPGRVLQDPPGHAGTVVPATRRRSRKRAPRCLRKDRAQRAMWANKTFEEFEKSVFKEPFPGGKYIVNGDVAFADRKQLQEFFETSIKQEPPQTRPGQLIVARAGGQDSVWNNTQKKQITYCVSTTFGARQATVVTAMQSAGGAWSQVADVAFVYIASQDSTCTASNGNVVFDVRPVNVNGEYLARAFFPNEPRAGRNVLIDDSSFQLDPAGKLTLVGILRHELGPHPRLAPRAHAAGVGHLLRGQRLAPAHLVRPLLGHALSAVQRRRRLDAHPDELRQERRRVPVRGGARLHAGPERLPDRPQPVPVACGPQTTAFNDQRVTQGEEKVHGPVHGVARLALRGEDGRRRHVAG